MALACAGIILAGGLNSRMGGRNKAFLEINGRRFLDRIVATLTDRFDECLLVVRDPLMHPVPGVTVVRDIFDLRSPLTGIHAGLVHTAADYAFCTSCDTPFLNRATIDILIAEIAEGIDVIVPADGTHYQPLCAVYSRRCIPFIEAQLSRAEAKADHLFEKIRLKTVAYERFAEVDPDLKAFVNVNTPEDLKSARAMIQQRQRH